VTLNRKILTPFNPREAISTQEAADRSGKSCGTIRFWCDKHGVGRKVGGEMHISRVALEILLEGDWPALRLYHQGERNDPIVFRYFAMFGLH
jgi:hypothetical protein